MDKDYLCVLHGGATGAGLRRTARAWMEGQRADAAAYSKHYANIFADRRPPGGASDGIRGDPPWRRRGGSGGGGDGGGRGHRVGRWWHNLLFIASWAVRNDGQPGTCARACLAAADLKVAETVLGLSESAQLLLAQLFALRGRWHRESELLPSLTGVAGPIIAATGQAQAQAQLAAASIELVHAQLAERSCTGGEATAHKPGELVTAECTAGTAAAEAGPPPGADDVREPLRSQLLCLLRMGELSTLGSVSKAVVPLN
jgi:hypothetical protein